MNADKLYVLHMQECLQNIDEFVVGGRAQFLDSKLIQSAVLYALQTLAESSQRLSEERKATHPEIDWVAIRGFRNRLVHDYLRIDLERVWLIITDFLPPLWVAVASMLNDLDHTTE